MMRGTDAGHTVQTLFIVRDNNRILCRHDHIHSLCSDWITKIAICHKTIYTYNFIQLHTTQETSEANVAEFQEVLNTNDWLRNVLLTYPVL